MANPNGHLQVINVIHGCQLTSHLNNHSLWNTNQTASPWYTDYFIPLIRGFIRGHRQRQQGGGGGGIISLYSHSTIGPWNPQILIALAPFRHRDVPAPRIMRSRYFCPPDRCIFTAVTRSLEEWPKLMSCGWADVTLELTSVHLWCVSSTESHNNLCTFAILQCKLSKATLHGYDAPECQSIDLFSLTRTIQGMDRYQVTN